MVLTSEEMTHTDSVHLIVRGQEFSLIYHRQDNNLEDSTHHHKTSAAVQAHVFYENAYDIPVRIPSQSRPNAPTDDDAKRRDLAIPFALPLPEALPSTALLHLAKSDNFVRIQYKLQVFRTGQGREETTVHFQTVSSPSPATDPATGDTGANSSNSQPGNNNNNNDAMIRTVSNNSSTSSGKSARSSLEPIPKSERLRELYCHHTRSSPDATPLLMRAPSWRESHATSHLHVQVTERVALVRSAFCGLYDYTTVTFRLGTQPTQLHASPDRDVRLILTDPENLLRTWIDAPTTFVVTGKVTQTIQWHTTSRRFVAYPIHKTWDLPEVTFTVEPLTEETKDGIVDQHILLDTALRFPSEPGETFVGTMLSIQSECMLGLCVMDAAGRKLTAGATPGLPLHVRGGGGLVLMSKERGV